MLGILLETITMCSYRSSIFSFLEVLSYLAAYPLVPICVGCSLENCIGGILDLLFIISWVGFQISQTSYLLLPWFGWHLFSGSFPQNEDISESLNVFFSQVNSMPRVGSNSGPQDQQLHALPTEPAR